MTKIRLSRIGSTHQPYYRVIVTDSRKKRDGQYIELLGSYDPIHKGLKINQERAEYWVSVGAQATNTTITLLTKAGVKHPFQVRKKPFKAKEVVAKTEETAIEATTDSSETTTVEHTTAALPTDQANQVSDTTDQPTTETPSGSSESLSTEETATTSKAT